MASIIFVTGNIGADAELKQIGQKQYAVFRVADTRKYTDGNGQPQSDTIWYRCMKSDPNGRLVSHLTKGTKVMVHGDYRFSTFQGKDGQTQYDHSVWVVTLEFMGGGKSSGGQGAGKDMYDYASQGRQQNQTYSPPPQYNQAPNPNGDLPF